MRKVEMLAEKYDLLDSLLFRISSQKETTVLAVPRSMCRQDCNSISEKFVCRTARIYKNLLNH